MFMALMFDSHACIFKSLFIPFSSWGTNFLVHAMPKTMNNHIPMADGLVYYYLFVYSGSKKLLQDQQCCRWMIYASRAYAKLDLSSHEHKTWWAKLFFCFSLGSDSSHRELDRAAVFHQTKQWTSLDVKKEVSTRPACRASRAFLQWTTKRVLDKTIYYGPAPGSVWVCLGRSAPGRKRLMKLSLQYNTQIKQESTVMANWSHEMAYVW